MPAADRSVVPARVIVYGVTGSGKSTAAARIAAASGLPLTSVDDLTWLPGWEQVEVEEQRRRFSEVCAGDSWILDTAYGVWLDIAMARAQLIVGLDYPRWRSLGRLIRRTAIRVLDRRPVCNGNTETLRQALSSDSIIAWHFRSFRSKRERLHRWQAQPDGPAVLLFTSPRDLDRWIATLTPPPRPAQPDAAQPDAAQPSSSSSSLSR